MLPAGTITDDHLAGITGTFGALPATSAGSTASVSYGTARARDQPRLGPRAAASTTFFQLLRQPGPGPRRGRAGSSVVSWTIEGREEGVGPFTLSVVDRYASDFDIAFEPAFDIADFVFALSTIRASRSTRSR